MEYRLENRARNRVFRFPIAMEMRRLMQLSIPSGPYIFYLSPLPLKQGRTTKKQGRWVIWHLFLPPLALPPRKRKVYGIYGARSRDRRSWVGKTHQPQVNKHIAASLPRDYVGNKVYEEVTAQLRWGGWSNFNRRCIIRAISICSGHANPIHNTRSRLLWAT